MRPGCALGERGEESVGEKRRQERPAQSKHALLLLKAVEEAARWPELSQTERGADESRQSGLEEASALIGRERLQEALEEVQPDLLARRLLRVQSNAAEVIDALHVRNQLLRRVGEPELAEVSLHLWPRGDVAGQQHVRHER